MGSNPIQGADEGRVGRAPASPGGCNPPATAVQVQLLPDTPTGLVAQLAEQDSLKVEVQGSTPCGATGRFMGVSSNGKTVGLHPADEGSTPSTVHCSCPAGERDIMAPSEGAGPGSTPGRGTASCLADFERRVYETRLAGSTPARPTGLERALAGAGDLPSHCSPAGAVSCNPCARSVWRRSKASAASGS